MRGASRGVWGVQKSERIVKELYLVSSTPAAPSLREVGGRIAHPFGGNTARPSNKINNKK